MKRTWILIAAALTWGGLGCSSDGGGNDTDADTSSPTDTHVGDTGGGGDTTGDVTVDTVQDTGPLTECDQGANGEKKAALLAAQPTIEGRQKSALTETVSWDSLEGDMTCSVELTFKDSNGNGSLDDFEDWTLTPGERAADLVARLSDAEKLGLLLHPTLSDDPKSSSNDVSAETQAFVGDNARFGLVAARGASITGRAKWANKLQELCEGTSYGIPFVLSLEPGHSNGNGRDDVSGFSKWPHELGLAASDSGDVLKSFGQVVSREYRAVGIRMALSIPADLSTDPRWYLSQFTLGEDPTAVSALVSAYIEGLQGEELGQESVAAVVSHFPGAGATTDGWDGRLAKGKHLTYPGDNLDAHLSVFSAAVDAGAASVMTAYQIPEQGSWSALDGALDGTSIEQVGASFNSDLVTTGLRDGLGFDGLVIAPWGVLDDAGGEAMGAPWGVESLSASERAAKAITAGVDQLGGLGDPSLLATAKSAGSLSDADIDRAASHALSLMFALGLFEDPYIDEDQAPALVNTDDSYRSGLDAQNRSMVLIVNEDKPSGWLNGEGDGSQSGDKANAGNGSGKVLPAPPGEAYVAAGCSYYIMGNFDLDYVRSVSTGYGELTNDATEIAGVPVSTAAERLANSNYVFIRVDAPYSEDPDSGSLEYCAESLEYASNDNSDALDDLAFARQAIDALPSSTTQIVVGVDAGRASVVSEILAYDPSGLYLAWSVSDKVFLDVAFGIVDGVGVLPMGLPDSDAAAASQDEDVPGDGQHSTFVRGFGLTTSSF